MNILKYVPLTINVICLVELIGYLVYGWCYGYIENVEEMFRSLHFGVIGWIPPLMFIISPFVLFVRGHAKLKLWTILTNLFYLSYVYGGARFGFFGWGG